MREVEKSDGDTTMRETIEDESNYFFFVIPLTMIRILFIINNQLYFEESIQDNQNFNLDDCVCLWCCLKYCYLLCVVYVRRKVLTLLFVLSCS